MRNYVFRKSATRVESALSCFRKWWLDNIEGLGVTSKSQAVGTAVHKQIELYLAKGQPFDFTQEVQGKRIGEIAISGLQHLPQPMSPGLLVEHDFEWQLPGSQHVLHGQIDLCWSDRPEVKDHKTTAGLGWAKTQQQLEHDMQANLYAAQRMHKLGAKAIDLGWIYYTTNKPHRSSMTPGRVTLDHSLGFVDLAVRTLDQMTAAAAAGDSVKLTDLQPNVGHCEAYGGCPHKSLCKPTLTTAQKWESIHMQSAADFVAQVKAKQQAKAGGAQVNPPPPAGAQPQQPPPPPAQIPVQPPPPPAQVAPPQPWELPGVNIHTNADGSRMYWDGAAWQPIPAAQVPPPPPAAAAAAAQTPPPPEQTAAEPPKRGRGRPRKQQTAPTTDDVPPFVAAMLKAAEALQEAAQAYLEDLADD